MENIANLYYLPAYYLGRPTSRYTERYATPRIHVAK